MTGNLNRRSEERARTVFLPSYIERNDRVDLAIMRDRSGGGARFTAQTSFRVGERLRYATGDGSLADGIVKWCEGHAFGVENTSDCTTLSDHGAYGYRSVRVPFSFPVMLTGSALTTSAKLKNISLLGGCVETDKELRVGSLLTVECFGAIFEAATVKWTEDGAVGLKWGRAMKCSGLATFLDHLQEKGKTLFTQAPIFA